MSTQRCFVCHLKLLVITFVVRAHGKSSYFIFTCRAASSIRDLIEGFVRDTLGEEVKVPKGNTTEDIFSKNATQIVGGIADAIIIDCEVEIETSFGLNLNKVFDESATITNRLPTPFLQIKTFDIAGEFGLKEWTDSVALPDLGMMFGISVSVFRGCKKSPV